MSIYLRKYNLNRSIPQSTTQTSGYANCTGNAGTSCLLRTGQTMQLIFNKQQYNYVRVPTSLYTATKAGMRGFIGSQPAAGQLRWNQSSDRAVAHISTKVVPSHGNSTRTSLTRHRPGAGAPGGEGVDVKHGSYQRRLNRLKGGLARAEVTGTGAPNYLGGQIPANTVTNNKVQKASIVAGCTSRTGCSL